MEDLTIRRRNRLRHHYTMTSNVLLFGYKHLSDGAKLTYQVIDSFDWSDSAGLRKGFAFPSLQTLAKARGVEKRSLRRHLAELEQAGLITRKERAGKPNLLIIEDPSVDEEKRYIEAFAREGEDRTVRPTPDRIVRPIMKKEEGEERQIVNEDDSLSGGDRGREKPPEHIGQTIKVMRPGFARGRRTPPHHARREYLTGEMLAVLKDEHSLGYYRRVAEDVQPSRIFEVLSIVRKMAREGGIRKSRGALFTSLLGVCSLNPRGKAETSPT